MFLRSGNLIVNPTDHFKELRSGKMYSTETVEPMDVDHPDVPVTDIDLSHPSNTHMTPEVQIEELCYDPEVHNAAEIMVSFSTDQTFQEDFMTWKAGINEQIIEELGIECDDIPDFPYYDCFIENVEMVQVLNQIRSQFYQQQQEEYQDESFCRWIDTIDKMVIQEFQVTYRDIPDLPYYDYFTDGYEPLEVVNIIKQEFY